MSIEQTLERIAVALEKIEARFAGNVTTAAVTIATPAIVAPVAKDKKKTAAAAPVAAPVIAAAEPSEFDLPGQGAEEPLTFEHLKGRLTLHATTFGTKVTLPIMVKHGADNVTPKMNTIPEANWKACLAEINADLKKQGK